jgi:large subunit ribosomal protein L17
MRHRKSVRRLNRTPSHRRALLANLAAALIQYKKIKTTVVKAKVLRSYIERLITKARVGSLHARRLILKQLTKKDVVRELITDIAPKYANTPGGYTRITKIGQRRTDAAEMALIELIGFENVYKKRKEESEEKRRKRREKKEKEKEEAKVQETPKPVEEKKEA